MPQRFFLGAKIAEIQRRQCVERARYTETYPVFVCQTCSVQEPRRARRGANFNPEKSKAGVYATWAGPCCRNCGSSRIACVDLVGHRIRALLRTTDAARRDIMLCSQCVLPTATAVIFGDLPYCSSCYHKNMQLHQGVCMCGLVHSTGAQQTLINPAGELAVYQFCATHRHIRPDTIVKVPLHLIRSRRAKIHRKHARNEARAGITRRTGLRMYALSFDEGTGIAKVLALSSRLDTVAQALPHTQQLCLAIAKYLNFLAQAHHIAQAEELLEAVVATADDTAHEAVDTSVHRLNAIRAAKARIAPLLSAAKRDIETARM